MLESLGLSKIQSDSQKIRLQADTRADGNFLCKKYVKRHQAKKTTETLTLWHKT